ncbi:MAG: SIMPL domain-containing protein [Acidimicrobiia bacterium]
MGDSRLVAVGVVATALLLGGCATQGASAASTDAVGRTITGTATGKVEGVPDTLTVTLGVESQAPSAQAALAQNADRSTRVIASLKASGVAPKDLQTTQLSLNPTFDQRGRITGYAVSNLVTAKVHDVVNAGKVVDAAAAQAGNDIRVEGVALSIEDTGALVAAARADAVTRARAQARQLARAADVRLGPVQKITERQPTSPPLVSNRFAADVAQASTPIEPGSQELTVDVTVVFRIG